MSGRQPRKAVHRLVEVCKQLRPTATTTVRPITHAPTACTPSKQGGHVQQGTIAELMTHTTCKLQRHSDKARNAVACWLPNKDQGNKQLPGQFHATTVKSQLPNMMWRLTPERDGWMMYTSCICYHISTAAAVCCHPILLHIAMAW
jgi:hypothetical protein